MWKKWNVCIEYAINTSDKAGIMVSVFLSRAILGAELKSSRTF